MDGEFSPEYSSNVIYYDTNANECLTTHIEDMETDISSLQTGKANTNHIHTEYSPIDHTHTGYVTEEYVNTHINGKVDKVDGKELSSNDYTDAERTKLAGIATGANNYTLPTAGSTLGGVKTTSTVSSNSGYTACPIIGGVPYYKDTNTTYDSLKNPHKLTLQFNGSTNKTYDGSSAQTFNVTPGAIGMADYVVAQGTSGRLTYRKWNSGVSEAWYYEHFDSVPLTTAMGGYVWSNNLYYARGVNFPSGLFVDIPIAVGNVYSNGYTFCQVCSAIKSMMVYRIWSTYSTTIENVFVNIHVVGRWK